MTMIKEADKRLTEQLNYGGITLDPDTNRLVMDYAQGDLTDEIGQMRRLSQAFDQLADALEDQGVACSERLPTEDDADANGFVEWRRSGRWVRNLVSGGQPVDATHWRRLPARQTS